MSIELKKYNIVVLTKTKFLKRFTGVTDLKTVDAIHYFTDPRTGLEQIYDAAACDVEEVK